MEKMMPPARCRVCGDSQIGTGVEMGAFNDYALRSYSKNEAPDHARGRLYRCEVCSIAFRHPCLSTEQLSEIYADADDDQYHYDDGRNAAWNRAREILDRADQHGRVQDFKILDVGCFHGGFLESLPDDWQKFGIEPSRAASAAAAEKGITTIGKSIDEALTDWQSTFDAACLFDVFEHLENPAAALDKILDLLKPGGRLLVSTLDLDSWLPRLMGIDHWYYQTPQHITIGGRRFVNWYCRTRSLSLNSFRNVAHRDESFGVVAGEAVAAVSIRMRRGNRLARLPLKLIHRLPKFRHLIHSELMPSTFSLRDHMVFEIIRSSQPV